MLLLLVILVPIALWVTLGEKFLSVSHTRSSEVLVVEGWIGLEAMRAAREKWGQGSYRFLVATGSMSGEAWNERRWSYAKEAEELFLRMGVPKERLIVAIPRNLEVHRTFECASAVYHELVLRGIRPEAIDVFTLGAHGRRSRTIYAKVFSGYSEVGVISWMPPTYQTQSWWTSSERTLDLLKESGAYLFELFLNGGRTANKA